MFNTKSILASKTFWLNLIGTAILVLETNGAIMPAAWIPYSILVLGILNILNRFLTNTGVAVGSATIPGNKIN